MITHKQLIIYENLEVYNLMKKKSILVVFDDMITDMEVNKKLSPLLIELFLRGRVLNISLVFVSQACVTVPEAIRLNAAHFFYHENTQQEGTSTNSIKSFL